MGHLKWQPPHEVRFDWRTILLALILALGMVYVAHASYGFTITGETNPTEAEALEGYFPVGAEFLIVAHPKSPVYNDLLGMRGQTIRITVEPVR